VGLGTNIVAGNNTVLIGTDLGYVKGGTTITPTRELLRPEGIEGLRTSPTGATFLTKEEYQFAFSLLELTLENIKIWLDSGNSIAAGPPRTLNIGHGPSGDVAVVTERVLVITGLVPGVTRFVRTITASKAVLLTPGETKITQFEEQMLPMTFVTNWDATLNRCFGFSDATS